LNIQDTSLLYVAVVAVIVVVVVFVVVVYVFSCDCRPPLIYSQKRVYFAIQHLATTITDIIAVSVPTGEGKQWRDTKQRHLGNAVSLVTASSIVLLSKQNGNLSIRTCVTRFRRGRNAEKNDEDMAGKLKPTREKNSERNFLVLLQLRAPLRGATSKGVRRGVSKGVEDGCRLPALQAGHPWNGLRDESGVAGLQGVEGLGMSGLGETLGSPWPALAICPWQPALYAQVGSSSGTFSPSLYNSNSKSSYC
jgi:hypothetical protein